MRPWVFSELEFEENGSEWKNEGVGWHKRNDIAKNGMGEKMYYTFSFTYTFKHAGDRVYFAYNRPYTVTMHKNMLKDVRRRVEERAKKTVKFPESGLADASALRKYVETRCEFSYNWLKSENFQVETSDFMYRQETLCRSFSGFPIELITITAAPYSSP
eukprot:TRINITY_DN8165_c0_g2_i1.p2 TRINITY_DN8165_c0_g2~~TRINITY_DN8165_c0_g2_i1.p2  ORF type:complete len:159 (+),score=48.19 TRINITY_DN8165_c0_g2_i1:553-1029(+)